MPLLNVLISMQTIVLDGSAISDRDSFFRVFWEAFSVPLYFWNNLDALYDILSETEWGVIEWNQYNNSLNKDFEEAIMDIFQECNYRVEKL